MVAPGITGATSCELEANDCTGPKWHNLVSESETHCEPQKRSLTLKYLSVVTILSFTASNINLRQGVNESNNKVDKR